jgi:RNA polymerase sigma-70 factor (ECF subfamily)
MDTCLGTVTVALPPRYEDSAERSIIERCRRRDLEAFGKLVDAYQSRVFGFVRRMVKSPEDAQDVTQEVFVRAFQAIERFDGRCTFRTWLFRIAHNLCVDRSRRQERRPTVVSVHDMVDEGEEFAVGDFRWDPETMVLDEEFRTIVEAAIGTMSEKLRSVLLLHDREGMAYDEIAQALDIPTGTVKSRLFLARTHLQRAVHAYWQGEVS